MSFTPTLQADGNSGASLEVQLEGIAKTALSTFVDKSTTLNSGTDGIYLVRKHVNAVPSTPFRVPFENSVLSIPKIDFDLGIKIVQTRIMHDRAKNYLFALAIEDCVNGNVSSASRSVGSRLTELVPVTKEDQTGDAILQNGSILKPVIKGYFPFEELEAVKHGEVYLMPNPKIPS